MVGRTMCYGYGTRPSLPWRAGAGVGGARARGCGGGGCTYTSAQAAQERSVAPVLIQKGRLVKSVEFEVS
jgi:hypothetical protein